MCFSNLFSSCQSSLGEDRGSILWVDESPEATAEVKKQDKDKGKDKDKYQEKDSQIYQWKRNTKNILFSSVIYFSADVFPVLAK